MIFADFSFKSFFYHSLPGIKKADKIVYSNFFGKLKILLHLGFYNFPAK